MHEGNVDEMLAQLALCLKTAEQQALAGWEDPTRALAAVAVDRLIVRLYQQSPSAELLEAVLAVIGKYAVDDEVPAARGPIEEHAIEMAGGGMQVRWDDSDGKDVFPLSEWIPAHQRNGGRVHRRIVLVLKEWTEVPR